MTLDLKSTFIPPLLDGSRDLLQIIAHNAQHNAPYPLFRYASANGAVETITWGGATKAFDVAARFVLDSATFKVAEDADAPPVVAILANLDSITYYALVVGIMKAGFTAFPISTRNSADGVAHLLAKTSSRLLFASADAAVARLAELLARSLKQTTKARSLGWLCLRSSISTTPPHRQETRFLRESFRIHRLRLAL
ncbi:hypothetical protein BJ912DRAFT_846943 [Pholiota molesta]|nr:hypothetical protein BJ912DRAFT_846943 [Pholiota molesta]